MPVPAGLKMLAAGFVPESTLHRVPTHVPPPLPHQDLGSDSMEHGGDTWNEDQKMRIIRELGTGSILPGARRSPRVPRLGELALVKPTENCDGRAFMCEFLITYLMSRSIGELSSACLLGGAGH